MIDSATKSPVRLSSQTTRVALVLDTLFGERINVLNEEMPIWVIESPSNLMAVKKIREVHAGAEHTITTFPARQGESLEAVCERIVPSLDQHFDEHAQAVPYNELQVIGVSVCNISLRPFLDLGFCEFRNIPCNGFLAQKQA